MKPKNFPARKQQRREAAVLRARNHGYAGIAARDMPVSAALRSTRTKKRRAARV